VLRRVLLLPAEDFDEAIIPRRKQPKNQQMMVRMMLPMSIRCGTCGTYIRKGTKFNSRKEDCIGEVRTRRPRPPPPGTPFLFRGSQELLNPRTMVRPNCTNFSQFGLDWRQSVAYRVVCLLMLVPVCAKSRDISGIPPKNPLLVYLFIWKFLVQILVQNLK
jgi:hypothetical protein